MDRELWHRVQELFDAALDRRADERTVFLDTACPDPAVRAEVEALLEAHETTGAADHFDAAWQRPDDAGHDATGTRIGPYRVLREIGQGGMGVVYLAERADGQFEQTVALKLLHRLGRRDVRARFLAERQILAGLDHPHIARLLDGGVTDDGAPYFAMEHVEGEPITDYADRHRLPVEARLRLFRQACAAVQHAHRNLIVHRDLKPSNILVTAEGEVKLLDFGIAKLIGPEPAAEPLHTQTGQRWMTPTYAAPEQITGGAITTATDTYALGVVLFELLTGHRPYRLTRALPHEAERVIVEEKPTKPSAAVAWAREGEGDGEPQLVTSETVGAARASEPQTLQRRLRGDLDTIVLKALDKEPERRYTSAEAFGDDIERHLAGLPVLARPATLGYRTRSFVRRHRVAVAAAALIVCSLVAGLVGTAWQAQRATAQARLAEAERNRARTETAKAEQALDFLVALFESSDPNVGGGDTVTAREVTAREVLDRGTQRLDAIEQPAVRATLLDAVGRVYQNLGLLPEADTLLSEALTLRRALPDAAPEPLAASLLHLGRLRNAQGEAAAADTVLRQALALRAPTGENDLGLAAVQHALGEALNEQDRYDEAEVVLRAALATRRAHHDATYPDVQATQRTLFFTLHRQGDYAASEALFRDAVAHSDRTPERVDQGVIDNHIGLGMMLYRFQHDYDGAEVVLRNARAMSERHFGAEHPNTAEIDDALAKLLRDRGRYDEAERFARASLAVHRETLGDEHRDTLLSKATLASILWHAGRDFDEAERLYRDVLAVRRQRYDEENLFLLSTQLQLAGLLRDWGRTDEAEAILRHTLAVSRTHYGEEHAHVIRSLQGLGLVREAEGQSEEAEALFRHALDLRHTQYPDDHWLVAYAEVLLAGALTDLGRTDEAERLLLSGLPVLERELGEHARLTRRALERAVALYEAVGRPDEAERTRRRLDADPSDDAATPPPPATRRAER